MYRPKNSYIGTTKLLNGVPFAMERHMPMSEMLCYNRLLLRIFIASLLFLVCSCGEHSVKFSTHERQEADSIAKSTKNVDSLAHLQKQLETTDNVLGNIVALREYGKALRNESRLEEALFVHSKGLALAEKVHDTIEWVQALNNVGTDYRRLGVLDEAQEYHYKAWKLSEENADTSFTAKKNRVVSLNGLGNIYMTIGNYNRADSALRMALEGERELKSDLGMAINYANLGSIFEHRGQIDSAWAYYRQSMTHNQKAGNDLGVSLCHNNFGALYEKAHRYEDAIREYKTAYELMSQSKDEWHTLNALTALANVYLTMGNNEQTLIYLNRAKTLAQEIKSIEHQAEIESLYYKYYKHIGDYSKALAYHERASALQDSMVDIEKVNRIQNTSLSIERSHQQRQMAEVNYKLENERTIRYWAYGVLILILLVTGSAVVALLYIQRIRSRNHQALKQMSMMRETFFTNITHEFRTPLTVIQGLSQELINDDKARVQTREKATVIQRQGNSLLALINQLLDISKIKSAVGDPDWFHGNITAHIGMVVESYSDYARYREVELHFMGKEEVEMDFVPDYTNKVMNNLLSNAFKFTPKYGKINVVLWKQHEKLFIDVSDTGKGIPGDALPHIFKPFYQSEPDTTSIGTGIGLALVKQVIDNVDGTITVESSEGKGTIFHITIPIHHNSKQPLALYTQSIGKTPLIPEATAVPQDRECKDSECRILVIEDNADVASYIGSQLSLHCSVGYATNGREGLEKATEMVPDLIITDLMMPEIDGLEVCRRVRASEILNHIPIIVVTAKVSEEDRVKGLKAGADAYLAKPFNHDELQVRVEKLLEQRQLLREKYSQAIAQGQATENIMSDADSRFLSKTLNTIYVLMEEKQVNTAILAERLCLSERQFRRKLTALTGDTPAAFILRTRMERAKQLLGSKPDWTLETVAYHCGFENYSVFYQAFKKYYNIPPSRYRQAEE